MSDDVPDELEPDDDSRPLRSTRRRQVLRLVAIVGMALLVLPGLIGTFGQANRSATYACEIARQYYAPNAAGVEAKFRIFPLEAAGWQCFVPLDGDRDMLIATLGPIPGMPNLRPVTSS